MTSPDSLFWAHTRIGDGGVQTPLSTHSRQDNETIITYLERLCDEYNAIPIDEN